MLRKASIIAFVVGICQVNSASADEPRTQSAALNLRVQQSVDRATKYLQKECSTWWSTRACYTCHHMAMPLLAFAEADLNGYATDRKFTSDMVEAVIGSPQKLISSKLFDDPNGPQDTRPLAKGVRVGAAFIAVAARAMPSVTPAQIQSLHYIADHIEKKQRADGGWEFFLSRPPINENETTEAAWLIMALQGETKSDASDAHRAALAKALAWYDQAKLGDDLGDKVLKILVALRGGKSRAELQPAIDELFRLQQPDGGWSQLPDGKSDAFATGESLYVLTMAGYTVTKPEIKRSIEFLLTTQKPDGSWTMSSRSSPCGKPGSAKLLTPITVGAASWATMGLARAVPKSVAKR